MLHVFIVLLVVSNVFASTGKHTNEEHHDAFLGKDVAPEFDELTPEQAKAKLA